MGFIDHDQVPISRRQKLLLPFTPLCQMARRKHDGMGVPGIVTGSAVYFPAEDIVERVSVIARYVQHELFVQLFLPLHENALGNQDQHSSHDAGQNELANRQAGFNRLSQADFVAQHEPFGKPLDDGVGHASLVRPRTDRAGFHSQAVRVQQVRDIAQKLKDDPLPLVRIDMLDRGNLVVWILWFLVVAAELLQRAIRRPQLQQLLLDGFRDRHRHPVRFLPFPEPVETMSDLGQMRRGTIPRVEDHERFVVVFERRRRFVDTAGKADAVAVGVLEQALFRMVVAVRL